MNSLFKYVPITDYSLKSIEDESLWFSSIENFNDALEWEFDFRTLKEKDIENIVNIYLQYSIDGLIRYVFIEHLGLKKVKSREIINYLKDNNDKEEVVKIKLFLRCMLINTLKVCCLSKKENIKHMWSFYADGMKGVCIEIDFKRIKEQEDFFFSNVKYIERIQKISINDIVNCFFIKKNKRVGTRTRV